jgi:hypothetical protein
MLEIAGSILQLREGKAVCKGEVGKGSQRSSWLGSCRSPDGITAIRYFQLGYAAASQPVAPGNDAVEHVARAQEKPNSSAVVFGCTHSTSCEPKPLRTGESYVPS